MIYVHNNFHYAVRDFSPKNLWEGHFVYVFGNGLKQKVTICNIYRPARDIDTFMNGLTRIRSLFSQEHSDKFIVGDLNLDLLKTNTRANIVKFST